MKLNLINFEQYKITSNLVCYLTLPQIRCFHLSSFAVIQILRRRAILRMTRSLGSLSNMRTFSKTRKQKVTAFKWIYIYHNAMSTCSTRLECYKFLLRILYFFFWYDFLFLKIRNFYTLLTSFLPTIIRSV